MTAGFSNVYDDRARASAYATLEFPGTYALAFRDLPAIIGAQVRGRQALDFGCGAGRSTRFLRSLGFEVTGVDVAEPMLAQARALDPGGDYRLVADGDLGGLEPGRYDLVLSAFTLDNVATLERKVALLGALERLLRPGGRIVNVVSSPEIYRHEWASFSTRDFPENLAARSGDLVRIVMLDVDDRRPVEDVLCSDADYRRAFERAGLTLLESHAPLATGREAQAWVSETAVAPWKIHVLGRAA
jgi:SAM-dependent methyltransferase